MKRAMGWAAFWALAATFYIQYFGREGADVFRIALPLLAVAFATELTIGGVLLPRYLLRGHRTEFLVYTCYTVVLSFWLVLGLVVGEFMVAGYRIDAMSPAALDRTGLLMGVYVVVAVALCIRLIGHWDGLQAELAGSQRAAKPLEIQVDRRTVRLAPERIAWLESAGDYVLVNTDDGQHMTKARLGQLAARLEDAGFLRVHRSFVVRRDAVDVVSATELQIRGTTIPVSRTYREAVREALGS
ncbi:MAG: LytTR family transcriptional regulator [Rhodothermales bacterium]|nr:LytTR family transcriptional regulator [Rhodothermales bacterium]MBO6780058.1 LytTR family transcriptional regulator [Rhodothermales bacterium]